MEKEGEKKEKAKEKAKGEKKFVRAYEGESWRTRIYETSDGRKYVKEGGSRSWRNNNPGNLKYGEWKNARRDGAIGVDRGGFAIFPDIEIGTEAQYKLIKRWQRENLTLEQFVYKYAPPNENDTEKYLYYLKNKLDIERTDSLQKLNDKKIKELMKWIKRYEGWRKGRTYYK